MALSIFFFLSVSLSAQTAKPLLLGLASISGGIETLYVTKKIGAFKRNGLDVDFLLLQGGSQALQVLLSGEIKLISGGGGTAAQRARFKGAGNLLVATYTPTMPYSLYVNGKISDPKRLKGAKIAISRFGSSSDFAARYMVSRLGLDPAKDVTIMQIGNQRERMSALVNGSHKAHYNGAGAVIVILKSEGYTLLWPKETGTQPYAAGRGDAVVELRWREGSVLSPPSGWFHQHFNTGKEAARQLALRFGSRLHPIGLHQAAKKKTDGVYISVKNGGTMIEYEEEDPEIRRRFAENLRRVGTELRMT